MVAVRKDYAAPTGLEFCLVCGSTMMPRLRCHGRAALLRRPDIWAAEHRSPAKFHAQLLHLPLIERSTSAA